jgi:homoserine kinase
VSGDSSGVPMQGQGAGSSSNSIAGGPLAAFQQLLQHLETQQTLAARLKLLMAKQ